MEMKVLKNNTTSVTSCKENKTIIKSTVPHIFPWITLFCINLERIKTKKLRKRIV